MRFLVAWETGFLVPIRPGEAPLPPVAPVPVVIREEPRPVLLVRVAEFVTLAPALVGRRSLEVMRGLVPGAFWRLRRLDLVAPETVAVEVLDLWPRLAELVTRGF